MTRKQARELMMQLLYQMELMNDHSEEAKAAFIEKNVTDKKHVAYAETVINTILENREAIDEKINGASNKWNTSRMAKVDLAIVRLAVCEMLYMDDIPDAVAINEAVSMAKKFASDESGSFINGILGKISKEKDAQ